jgi:hypothetical protein
MNVRFIFTGFVLSASRQIKAGEKEKIKEKYNV